MRLTRLVERQKAIAMELRRSDCVEQLIWQAGGIFGGSLAHKQRRHVAVGERREQESAAAFVHVHIQRFENVEGTSGGSSVLRCAGM